MMSDIKYIDLKEDSVQFHLFPDLSHSLEDGKFPFACIDELMVTVNKIVNRLSQDYIWHNEEFQISPKNFAWLKSSGNGCEPFSFYGTLNYAENIEDEWFLVYLLVELTKQIDGLIVQVKDGDGEFLLIEAAEHLPTWVTPETSEGRTFIYNGEIHLLPLSLKTNGDHCVTVEILKYVRENCEQIKCNHAVQETIKHKISKFSNQKNENYHNAILYVPVGVASLLNANPKLIAPAIRAFCDRDLIDIKACRAMKYFPPENRVYTQIQFTKLLYLMLVTSKFIPDKRTGWNLPLPRDENYKSHLLGVKLACGFEILVNHAKGESKNGDSQDSDLLDDPHWKKFLDCLRARNYFRGLLEHSKQYNQLLDTAKRYYSSSCEKLMKPNKAQEVLETLGNIEINIEELKRKELNLPKSDDDSWMNITREELDSMLKQRFGCQDEDGSEPAESARTTISGNLEDFLNHMSGIEGAEFPQKGQTAKNSGITKIRMPKKRKTVKFSPDTKVSDTSSRTPSQNSNSVSFEPEGFINAIQSILDFSIPDDNYWDSEGSGMSSYEDESDVEFGDVKDSSSKEDKVLVEYMKEMDRELLSSTMGKSFVTKNAQTKRNENEDDFADTEDFKPVDIDLNALKNIVSSYRAQLGEAGPAENLLGPLGVKLDDIEADVD